MTSQPPGTEYPLSQTPVRRVSEAPAECNYIELLAALIGGHNAEETARSLLAVYKNLRAIRQARAEEMAVQVRGLGFVGAARLIAALELGQRLAVETEYLLSVVSPAAAAALVQYEMSTLEWEEMRVILVNSRTEAIGIETLYRGTLDHVAVRIGEMFRPALRRNARAVIFVHNHPSGNPVPSEDDTKRTVELIAAGKLLDVKVLDHLIIGSGQWWRSLKNLGVNFD